MITLGIYNGGDESAAVVAERGTVLSAVHSLGYSNPSSCIRLALEVADLAQEEISVVSEAGQASTVQGAQLVAPAVAQAAQARAVFTGDHAVLVVHERDGDAAVVRLANGSCEGCEITGARRLLEITRSVAQALGLGCTHPISELELIARPVETAALPNTVSRSGAKFSADMDFATVHTLLGDLRQRCSSPADIDSSSHIEVIRLRAIAAAATLEGLADICAAVVRMCEEEGRPSALAGTAFTSPEFVTRVRRRVEAKVVPVPDSFGAALGAALVPQHDVRSLTHLALGLAFSEADIKATLENCRLDYVYEPSWPRLFSRVSELLEIGALVGWFQGRADFSRQSFGSRSILCDPSRRYSRENVNAFLLNRPVAHPLSLSIAGPTSMIADAAPSFSYNVSSDGQLRRHVVTPEGVPEFHSLLRVHRERTQVEGLLNVPMLAGPVLAQTPRDAIRQTFASATDVLVIGRFLVAKDYWLLRSRVAGT